MGAQIDAGLCEAKARKAAEKLAGYENRFAGVKSEIVGSRGEFAVFSGETKAEFASVRGGINLLKRMLASVLWVMLAVALRTFLY